MNTDDSKAVVRRFVREVFQDGRPEAVDALVADDFVPHTWPSVTDREGLKTVMGHVHEALADVRFEIQDMVAEGDLVAVRLTSSARQVGEFMKIPPSGRSYSIEELHMFRVRDGRVTEHWHQFDIMGLMKQLGASPTG
jgi:steroid delta-isomerase-like uncharacterized protein